MERKRFVLFFLSNLLINSVHNSRGVSLLPLIKLITLPVGLVCWQKQLQAWLLYVSPVVKRYYPNLIIIIVLLIAINDPTRTWEVHLQQLVNVLATFIILLRRKHYGYFFCHIIFQHEAFWLMALSAAIQTASVCVIMNLISVSAILGTQLFRYENSFSRKIVQTRKVGKIMIYSYQNSCFPMNWAVISLSFKYHFQLVHIQPRF